MTATSRTSTARKPRAEAAVKEAAPPPPAVSATAGLPLAQRVDALRCSLIDSIEREVSEGNVRVILWLADRLRVLDAGAAPEKRPAEELRAFFEQLDASELREFAGLAGRAG